MSIILALDAGHGGSDPGATSYDLQEKDITLNMVKRVKAYLEKYYPQIEVRLTRDADRYVSLDGRTGLANNWKADAFLSIHINSFDRTSNGFESFVYTTDDESSKSYAFQQKLHKPLADLWKSQGRRDRGKKKADFHVLREFKGASVLLELGFISNRTDANLLQNDTFLKQQAEAIGDAVGAYFGIEKSLKAKTIYRVMIDGTQVGAFAETDNVLRQVESALKSGKQNIKLVKK